MHIIQANLVQNQKFISLGERAHTKPRTKSWQINDVINCQSKNEVSPPDRFKSSSETNKRFKVQRDKQQQQQMTRLTAILPAMGGGRATIWKAESRASKMIARFLQIPQTSDTWSVISSNTQMHCAWDVRDRPIVKSLMHKQFALRDMVFK